MDVFRKVNLCSVRDVVKSSVSSPNTSGINDGVNRVLREKNPVDLVNTDSHKDVVVKRFPARNSRSVAAGSRSQLNRGLLRRRIIRR